MRMELLEVLVLGCRGCYNQLAGLAMGHASGGSIGVEQLSTAYAELGLLRLEGVIQARMDDLGVARAL
jgi:hypothetical protein